MTDYSRKDPRIRLLHSDDRQGRGRALNRAIREAQGSIVCYFDVDLATGMQHLPELIGAIRDGYDVATGSRLLPDSDIVRTGGREIASRSYNFLVRLFLGSRVFDHQCGFKAVQTAIISYRSCLLSVTATGSGIQRPSSACRERVTGSKNLPFTGVREKEPR